MDATEIGDAGAIKVGNMLSRNTSIATICLGDNRIGDLGLSSLFAACKRNKSLTALHIDRNRMSMFDAADAVRDFLCVCKTVIEMNLSSSHLGTDGIRALAPALAKNTTLLSIDLSFNDIQDIGARLLGEALSHNGTLIELNLKGNHIGNHGINGLMKSLHQNDVSAIQRMRKQRADVGYLKQWKAWKHEIEREGDVSDDHDASDTEANAPQQQKRTMSLEQLSALLTSHARAADYAKRTASKNPRRSMQPGTQSSNATSKAKRGSVMRVLGAEASVDRTGSFNESDDASKISALDALTIAVLGDTMEDPAEKKKHAQKAGVVKNPKGQTERVRKLAQKPINLPQRQTGIQQLDLSENKIGFEGGKSIGEALRSNAILLQLCLNHNPLTDAGCEAVIEDLKFNESLLKLEMKDCRFGDTAGEQLKDTFSIQMRLTHLDISNNSFTGKTVKALAAGLGEAKFPKLQSLVLITDKGPRQDIGEGAKALGYAMHTNNMLLLKHVVFSSAPENVARGIEIILQINRDNNTPADRERVKKERVCCASGILVSA